MAIIPKDGGIPMYGSISYISKTTNTITIRIAANSVTDTVYDIPVLLQLNERTIDDGVTFEAIFTELGTAWAKLYVKDASVNQNIYIDHWDSSDNFCRVWVVLDTLTIAQKDLVIEFDNTYDDNIKSIYIGELKYIENSDTYYNYCISLSPIHYWRLGEVNGATAIIDDVGTADGTVHGNIFHSIAGLLSSDPDTAMDINNLNSWAHVTSGGGSSSSTQSYTFLFTASSLGTYNDLISIYNADSDRVIIQTGTGGQIRIWKDNAQYYLSTDTPISINTTYHVAITDDSTTTRIYINGTELSTTAGPTLTSVVNGRLAFGVYESPLGSYNHRYAGVMDEITNFETVLSAVEISLLNGLK